MCFSAAASFVTAGITGAIGVVALARASQPRELPLAAAPLLFAAQQSIEGLLWLNAPDGSISTDRSCSFSLPMLWPVYLPMAVLLIEPSEKRRRLMLACLAAGESVAAYLLWWILTRSHDAQILNGHLVYVMQNEHSAVVPLAYLTATSVSLMFSSWRTTVVLGGSSFVVMIAMHEDQGLVWHWLSGHHPRTKKIASIARASWVIASLFAITPGVAHAQAAICQAPARIDATSVVAGPVPLGRVRNYRPIFQQCHNAKNEIRLATRRMSVDADNLLLMVDPSTLQTRLEHEQCWTCTDTDDQSQKATRLIRAVEKSSQSAANSTSTQSPVFNAGLSHSMSDGSFITGDLCPSRKPLDRGLLEVVKKIGPDTPVALAISGLWLMRHGADFQWLKEQERSGALEITWVNHSYHHPYVPGRPVANNFLLMPGFDMQSEILDEERLLIANGETPSIFFRFPGLVSDAALMQAVRGDHLIVLGADGWLVFAPPLRPGAILLIHPNGNEHPGLRLFVKLLSKGKLPRPFRPINDAP